MTNKELDDLIKQKLNSQTFEFDEKYWQLAALEIDKQRLKTKKMVWYKTSFYAAAIALFSLLGWFLVSNKTTTSNTQLVNNENQHKNSITKPNTTELNTNKVQPLSNQNVSTKQYVPTEQNNQSNPTHNSNLHLLADTENNTAQITDNQYINNKSNEDYLVIDGINLKQLTNNISLPSLEFKTINFENKTLPNTRGNKFLGTFNAGLEAGINSFNKPLNNNSMGYYLGARLYFDLGKISFNSNLHFENINQDLAPRNIVNKTYDFTSNTEIITIKNYSLNYAILGLNASYPVYKNHSLGVGMQYAVLVQSNDLFTTHHVELNTTTNQKTQNYNSNINKTDWQFTVNYQFRFSKHIALGASYVHGLNRVSKTDATGYNNQGIKLGLQYIIK